MKLNKKVYSYKKPGRRKVGGELKIVGCVPND
jgi:hypothetical protein